MKRRWTFAVAVLAAAGCGEPQLTVRASLDGEPVADLPVWLLPYDRTALLDSLVQESDEAEPAIPASWVAELDTLRRREASAAGDTVLAPIRARRHAVEARIDSVRAARRVWRERVHAPLDSLAAERMAELGRSARADTTGADGTARLSAGEGRAWIRAVYVLPEAVLEWNVPVTPQGDSTTVALTRENATERRFH
jgi:hypothetical protein